MSVPPVSPDPDFVYSLFTGVYKPQLVRIALTLDVFTPLASISFLLFILIYMPCVAVIATVSKESGSWKWALFLMVYTTVLAWLLSFAVFQIGSLMGF